MKAPAFQVYAAEFLADMNVMVMTTEEVGAYWLLILVCWREGCLPDDMEELATLSRVPLERFQASWDKRIKRCFDQNEDGTWSHPRLQAEREKQDENREKKRFAANKRHHGGSPPPTSNADAVQMQCTTDADAMHVECLSSSSSSSVTNVTGESPPNVIWDLGVPMLTKTGMKQADARGLLGKMAKDHGRPALARAIAEVSAANPPDPKAYLVKTLQGSNGNGRHNGLVL